MQSTITNSK